MTYDFAVQEAQRRARVMTRDYAIVYSEMGREYMVIPLLDAQARDLLIVDTVTIDKAVALQHEEILAGLAKERAHSRFVNANGQHIRWTYDGNGGMSKELAA